MHILRNVIHRLFHAAGDDGGEGGGGGGESTIVSDGDAGEGGDDTVERAQVEQRARDLGWSPRDQWRGPLSAWIDAPEFVQRGEQIMPILRNNLRASEGKISSLEAQLKKQSLQLQAANESIQVLINLNTEQGREAAKEKRRELLREQAAARRDGDTDREIELGEQIADVTSRINTAEAEAEEGQQGTAADKQGKGKGKGKTAAGTTPPPDDDDSANNPANDPVYKQWEADNPWFGKDTRRTALATAIARELRSNPANEGLIGRAFFDKVTDEVNKTMGGTKRATSSKVEGAAGGGGNGSGNGAGSGAANGKTYNDLPADAKAACERYARDVVGEGRAFKDIASWRKHYTTQYFNS